MAFGIGYITPQEFKSSLSGLDVSMYTNDQLSEKIAQASRLAETQATAKWYTAQYTERHPFKQSGMIYPRNLPVQSIDADLKLYVGPSVYGTVSKDDCFPNNEYGYIEVASLGYLISLTPNVIGMGLRDPMWEITYTGGLTSVPDNVKYAVAIITASGIAQMKLAEEGVAGVLSFTIGSYMVTVGRPYSRGGAQAESAGFAGLIPAAAMELLKDYKKAFVRGA